MNVACCCVGRSGAALLAAAGGLLVHTGVASGLEMPARNHGIDLSFLESAQADPGGPPASLAPGRRGGSYNGPGDFVPPWLPLNPLTSGVIPPGCSPALVPNCARSLCRVNWVRTIHSGCVECRCDVGGFDAHGWGLTLGELERLCNPANLCADANGDISVALYDANVCQVYVFMSSWLVAGSMDRRNPILGTVPIRACVNGSPLCIPSCEPIGAAVPGVPGLPLVRESGCMGCNPVQVVLTFNQACMCDAVQHWISALNSVNYPRAYWEQIWFVHIGIATCNGCGIIIDPDQVVGEAPSCPADWDGSGALDTLDFFGFTDAFLQGDADFNASGSTDSQDFFDFLAAFFTGCG